MSQLEGDASGPLRPGLLDLQGTPYEEVGATKKVTGRPLTCWDAPLAPGEVPEAAFDEEEWKAPLSKSKARHIIG